MPTKNSATTKTTKPRKRAAAATAPAPVTVARIDHSPRLFDAARRELAARGLPVELTRIRPIPGRQAVDVDVTPRPALNPRR